MLARQPSVLFAVHTLSTRQSPYILTMQARKKLFGLRQCRIPHHKVVWVRWSTYDLRSTCVYVHVYGIRLGECSRWMVHYTGVCACLFLTRARECTYGTMHVRHYCGVECEDCANLNLIFFYEIRFSNIKEVHVYTSLVILLYLFLNQPCCFKNIACCLKDIPYDFGLFPHIHTCYCGES